MKWQWGDVPAWVAIGISILAGLRAWWAGKKAGEASAGAASLEVSLARIADTLSTSASVHPQPSVGPDIQFTIEFRGGSLYGLRNVGNAKATGIAVTLETSGPINRNLPRGEHLDPFQAVQFLLAPTWGRALPADVLVVCDQWPEPRRVPLPPRI